jgi:hypothetical protein
MAEALGVEEAAVAIAAAANPITILRITMLAPSQETHPSLYVANSAVRAELPGAPPSGSD